jgi:hypothetical protein
MDKGKGRQVSSPSSLSDDHEPNHDRNLRYLIKGHSVSLLVAAPVDISIFELQDVIKQNNKAVLRDTYPEDLVLLKVSRFRKLIQMPHRIYRSSKI